MSKLVELENLNEETLKRVSYFFGLKGLGNAKYETVLAKVSAYMADNGIEEVPTLEELDNQKAEHEARIAKPVKEVVVVPVANPKFIRDYPKQKVVIESREEDEQYQTFSVNEYSITIEIGKEVLLPTPIIEMIKGLKIVRHKPDSVTGFNKSEEVNRYFVNKV